MSADATPISSARFADAIAELTTPGVVAKVFEVRNSIRHLASSNEQLRPFAEGTAAVLGSTTSGPSTPDQDCIDAIRENEVVLERRHEQVALLRAEYEKRTSPEAWTALLAKLDVVEKQHLEEGKAQQAREEEEEDQSEPAAVTRVSDPWSDGTFQTGTIRNGTLHMDPPGRPQAGAAGGTGGAGTGTGTSTSTNTNTGTGGSLTDEQLRRNLEERLHVSLAAEDEEEGLHL